MAIICIPVEVPDDELNGLLARLTAAQPAQYSPAYPQAASPVPTQQYARTESEFGYQTSQQPADPWASPATGAPSTAVVPQPGPTPSAGAAQFTPQVSYQPGGSPRCAHGEMKFVPAGVSKSTGRAYGAFYGCTAPRGQQQCKSIKVGQ